MKIQTIKKLTSREAMEFHDYKRTSGSGRKGTKKNKKNMRRVTRRTLKKQEED